MLTIKTSQSKKFLLLLGAVIGLSLPSPSSASDIGDQSMIGRFPSLLNNDSPSRIRADSRKPISLEQAERLERQDDFKNKDQDLPLDIRAEAIREAALSYGARAGLAFRTYEVAQELDTRGRHMDKVFDFTQLLVPAPSGLLIEPPIINESMNALLIEGNGQQAAVSDRVYNIVNNARIVSTSRTWRDYLRREWQEVEPPPDLLLPKTDEEREIWIERVNLGWVEGVRQANEIFEADLAKLNSDFNGMVRYRVLLAQGMGSPPFARQVDRGVTGGGSVLRVGDRAVQITGVPSLITGADQWQPASR